MPKLIILIIITACLVVIGSVYEVPRPGSRSSDVVTNSSMASTASLPGQNQEDLTPEEMENKLLAEADVAIKQNRMGPIEITVLGSDGNPIPGADVKIDQVNHEFLFGSTCYLYGLMGSPENNRKYLTLFKDIFNYATIPFAWKYMDGFERLDVMTQWCADNDIEMKGHPLLWGDPDHGTPKGTDILPPPSLQKKHVEEIVNRYKGIIKFWEVVNEPAHYDQPELDAPYAWVRAVDPDGVLVVNDFGMFIDGLPEYRTMVAQALRRGVPINAIGLQAHEPEDAAIPLGKVKEVLDEYAELGIPIHITEFSPETDGMPVLESPWRGTWTEEVQADYAEDFYRLCFAHPAVEAITWWDFTETGAFRPRGGLLRPDLTPKPAYFRLNELIHGEWEIHVQGVTDNSGQLRMDGFFGDYKVTASFQGKSVEAGFHLGKGKAAGITLRLP